MRRHARPSAVLRPFCSKPRPQAAGIMASSSDILNRAGDDVATIKRLPFWISCTIFFGLAVLAVLSRVFLKFRHKLSFGLDDYLLFFAASCLISGSGVLFLEIDNLYVGPAIQKDPSLVMHIDPVRMQSIFSNAIAHQHTFFTLLWTAIFTVKFSFLAFFYGMLNRMRTMKIYWWITAIVCVPSWATIVAIPFAICHHFGTESIKCMENPQVPLYTALMAVGGTLDALTDLMIVSIPVLVLRRVSIPFQQKFAVGAFLCLSLMMVVMTLVRSAKIHGPKGVPIDITWAVYWVHIEASIAIIMVSLTAFRTVFNLSRDQRETRERRKKPTTYLQRLGGGKKKRQNEGMELPQVPRATMTGMRTFIHGGKRESGDSTVILSHDDTLKSYGGEKDHYDDEEMNKRYTVGTARTFGGTTLASTTAGTIQTRTTVSMSSRGM
ncbi:hypothetical protein BDV95DRAFT_572287 [Massariosphaeria phaeospora]|uniref:Rhodopsin domain-containing protein n=1 Tax=Massariosphaeria phaeospora TaxID=100035 RepID=A0A7C8MBV2_9PLEO|nr:hypothetical protein BDV95DRAFT_572287 [Massariosphaeria phaeospora]